MLPHVRLVMIGRIHIKSLAHNKLSDKGNLHGYSGLDLDLIVVHYSPSLLGVIRGRDRSVSINEYCLVVPGHADSC